MSHLSLDQALSSLQEIAALNEIAFVQYDNPEREGDEDFRLVQPMYVVQSKANLLALCWQYAPSLDYRTFRLAHFVRIQRCGYPGMLNSASTFSLDLLHPWKSVSSLTQREHPYDRRSSRRRDAEIFYLEALASIRAQLLSGSQVRVPPLPPKLQSIGVD